MTDGTVFSNLWLTDPVAFELSCVYCVLVLCQADQGDGQAEPDMSTACQLLLVSKSISTCDRMYVHLCLATFAFLRYSCQVHQPACSPCSCLLLLLALSKTCTHTHVFMCCRAHCPKESWGYVLPCLWVNCQRRIISSCLMRVPEGQSGACGRRSRCTAWE